MPTGTPGPFGPQAVMMRASFQVKEVYSSSCSADPNVEADWINGMGSGTGWPGPGSRPGIPPRRMPSRPTPAVATDGGHQRPGRGGIQPDPRPQRDERDPTSITVRLWESGDTTSVDHKQFTNNPTLDVYWTDTPNAPSTWRSRRSAAAAAWTVSELDRRAPHRRDRLQ